MISRWRYAPFNGKPIDIRKDPSHDKVGLASKGPARARPTNSLWANSCTTILVAASSSIGHRLHPDDIFDVSEERCIEGTLFLRLTDGRGWVFDRNGKGSILCHRLGNVDNNTYTVPVKMVHPTSSPGFSPPTNGLTPGNRIRVMGHPEHDGKDGTVQCWLENEGKWQVRLDGTEKKTTFRTNDLMPLEAIVDEEPDDDEESDVHEGMPLMLQR